jgi:hypothetical protein
LLDKEIEKIESVIEGKEERKAFDIIKRKLKDIETETERLALIKKELGDSVYTKIFDTAIENIRLEESLKYMEEKKIEEKFTWHNSPNLKIILYLLGVAGIVGVLVLATKYTQNDLMFLKMNSIEKKINNIEYILETTTDSEKIKSKNQDNNMSK